MHVRHPRPAPLPACGPGGRGPAPPPHGPHVITADTNDTACLLARIEGLHSVLGFDGVVSSCDYYLPAVAHTAHRLGLPGPAPEAVEAACRKDLTRRVLAAADVPGPRFAICAGAGEAAAAARGIGYPLVVKPVDLCAGMLVRAVRDEHERERACQALAEFPVNARGQDRAPVILLEELLRGPEVSVETVSFGGSTHVVGVTDKSIGGAPAFVETGHMFPAGIDEAQAAEAAETTRRAVEALGLDQVVCHTELKLTADGSRLVEVNPRPAGNRITRAGRPAPGRVRDALGPLLPTLIDRLGGEVCRLRYVPDRPAALSAQAVHALRDADVVVVTGSTSVGVTDRLRALLAESGARMVVDTVACRPGHPMLLAELRADRWVVGLPGNPYAALVAAHTLLGPLLAGLTGRPLPSLPRVPVHGQARPAPGQTRLVPVAWGEAGARIADGHRAAFLRGAAVGDALAALPPGWSDGRSASLLLTTAG